MSLVGLVVANHSPRVRVVREVVKEGGDDRGLLETMLVLA